MWRQIEDYEGLYEVSDCGDVRRIGSNILKPQKDSRGYLYFSLSKDGNVANKKSHRLVAMAFVPNPNGYRVINHLDGNKSNNAASNLEWTTSAGNNQHAWDNGLNRNTEKQRASATVSGRKNVRIAHERSKRKVICLNNGRVYNSINEAEVELGVDHSKISAVARGRRTHSHGYRFAYVEAEPE